MSKRDRSTSGAFDTVVHAIVGLGAVASWAALPPATAPASLARALGQRLVVRHHLTGLDRDELDHYLTHRLRLAGCEIPLFEPPAIEALFQSARGLPRLINRIAHYALTAAAVNDARTVNAGHLEHAVAELRL